MVKLPFAIVVVLLTMILNSGSHAQSPSFSVANHKKVGSIFHGKKQLAGVCYFVDDRGYVATCFSNIRDCKEATVLFNDGQKFDVVGVVAASLGKDIAVLEIAQAGKAITRDDGALKLNPYANPPVDEKLVAWSGPMSIAAPASSELPKVKRRLLGEEFIAGQVAAPTSALGTDPDTMWIWFSHTRHRSCNGSPVFNRDGEVVAMLSGCLYSDPALFSAIHIRHVHDLLPRDGTHPKAKILRSNHTWVDPIPPVDSNDSEAQVIEREWSSQGGMLQRGLPLADRLINLQDRVVRIEQEKAEFEIFRANNQSEKLELLAEADKLNLLKAAVSPEEAYQKQETEIETVRDKDGKESKERKSVKTTSYRFSPRQLDYLKSLNEQLRSIESKLASKNSDFAFTTTVLEPFVATTRTKMDAEYLFIADPLGLRSSDEHRDLHARLSKVIDEGGAVGEVYIARAITCCNLKDYAGAASDLNEAKEVDTKHQPLCNVVEACILTRQGSSKGASEMRAALRDSPLDPRVMLIAASADLSSGSEAAAARKLQSAAKTLPNNYEIKCALAWIYATTSAKNEKLAMSYATDAVSDSAGRDWNSRAALAASYASSGKFDLAREQISIAMQQATGSALDSCKQWSQQVTADKPIIRDFK